MTDTTLPGDESADRVEPVDIQQEMQRSYIDYAMSVIVGRALPEVRDGLKPVHRRVLYAMFDSGFRPDRSHAKSARSVAETMGNYHPHGDASIYDTLVRMAQPWSLRYPLVDGQGNFGSPGNDPPAAMRYCVTGDALVALPQGRSVRIADIVPGVQPNSGNVIELKVVDRHGDPVVADRLFHSGDHQTYTVHTVEGHEVTGTPNHPLLCLVDVAGVPTLLWKLIEEISPDDCVVLQRVGSCREERVIPSTTPTVDDVPGLARFLALHGDDPDAGAIASELTDGRFYYARVASVTDAGVQPVYSLRVDTADHAFITNGFVSHNTEARLTPLAMEMLREIDEETVDFIPNYDGRVQEPTVLPSRFPNLLANGSGGIAVGMATNMPPHNLRELADAVFWCLENYEADEEATLAAVMDRIKGPDFPTAGLIVGSQGITDTYTTGRGSIRMRGVVEIEEDSRSRTAIVITELPYQVNHDNFITSIAEQVRDGKLGGIANVEDQGSDRVGIRIVVELKRDAVAKVVLNNLYKHTQLQTSFGANMLAIVDGVPRTLRLDQLIRHYVDHQLDVIVRRTTYRLRKANERAHILRGLVKALDALDEVIALIRASETVDIARQGLIELLDIDDIQAQAILDMQLRRLAALERQRIIDDLAKIEAEIADLEDILAKPERQRSIVRDELSEIVEKYGDDRRSRIVAADGEVTDEDLIAREDVVVTITETGYAKRTKTDLYRSQKRGGKGVQGRRPQAGRHRQPLLRLLDPRLDPVLHHTGPGVPRQGLRPARGVTHRARAARRQPVGVPAGRTHRPGHPDPQLRGRAVSGAGDAQRSGEEVQADRLRLQPLRRHRRGESARRRRTRRRRALLSRRRPAAGVGEGTVDQVLSNRRSATPDGSRDLWCAGHAVQHRRPAAEPQRGPRGHISAGSDRRRVRQADGNRGIHSAGARRQRHPDNPVRPPTWQSGRCVDRR